MNFYEPPQTPPKPDDSEARMWAMFCHLATFSGSIVPFGHVIGPLVVWLIKKDDYPLVEDQGKEAINFQLSLTLWLLLCIPLCFIVIGVLGVFALVVADLVLTIIAAIRANSGEYYRYPMTIRFIS